MSDEKCDTVQVSNFVTDEVQFASGYTYHRSTCSLPFATLVRTLQHRDGDDGPPSQHDDADFHLGINDEAVEVSMKGGMPGDASSEPFIVLRQVFERRGITNNRRVFVSIEQARRIAAQIIVLLGDEDEAWPEGGGKPKELREDEQHLGDGTTR